MWYQRGNNKKQLFGLLLVLVIGFASRVSAEEERNYTEGPVSAVTSVKIMDGQYENYLAYLVKTYKPLLEAQKEAGIILGYSIFDATARSPDEADLYLVVTYPNMASMDGLQAKTEPLQSKITGMNRSQAAAASADRTKMRTILGTELIRELILK